LVQGEYVDFKLSETKSQEHEFHAEEVNGINGGKLMCETRRDFRVARSQYHASRPKTEVSSEEIRLPRSVAPMREPKKNIPPRARGQGPREEGGEWTYVSKGRNSNDSVSSQSQNLNPTYSSRFSVRKGRGRPEKEGRGEGKSYSF
jgi:hypothetical protein